MIENTLLEHSKCHRKYENITSNFKFKNSDFTEGSYHVLCFTSRYCLTANTTALGIKMVNNGLYLKEYGKGWVCIPVNKLIRYIRVGYSFDYYMPHPSFYLLEFNTEEELNNIIESELAMKELIS